MMRKGLALFSLALAVLNGYFFYARYWHIRALFNEEGRYFDVTQQVVFHSQSGIAWGGFAILFLAIAGYLMFKNK